MQLFELLISFKDYKTQTKVLFISTSFLVTMFYISIAHKERYQAFLKTLSYFSDKLHFDQWNALLSIFQILVATVVIGSFIVLLFNIFGLKRYIEFMDEITRQTYIDRTRKAPLLFIISSILYLNLFGYYSLFKIEFANYILPFAISLLLVVFWGFEVAGDMIDAIRKKGKEKLLRK